MSAPDKIPSTEELIARARALAPKLRERALQSERDRNISAQSVKEFIEAGLVRVLIPKRWGGYEHDHETQFNIAVELGRSTCGSSAWCLNYLTDHACMLAHFPEEAQHDIWSKDLDACIATSAAPTGKAEAVSGGYRLNGRWSWCSGIAHSQWIMIGALIHEGENHDLRLCLVPVSELTVHDTWFSAGLSASGSNTVEAKDVFVPAHRTVPFATMRDGHSPGSKINVNPMYRAPFIALHSYALLGPALGLARAAYDDYVQWTRKRFLSYTQLSTAQHAPIQIAVSEIAVQLDCAEMLARRSLATARAHYAGMSMETRILLRRDFVYAIRMLRKVMDDLIAITGASGLMADNPVQRCWRDVHAISSHVMMNWDVAAENYGRQQFGLGRNEAYPAF